MKIFLFSLFNLCFIGFLSAQQYTVRGFIYDKANGEAMAFEKIRLLKGPDSAFVAGALTDVNGFFSIPKIEKGSYILKVDNAAYSDYTQNIELKEVKEIFDV